MNNGFFIYVLPKGAKKMLAKLRTKKNTQLKVRDTEMKTIFSIEIPYNTCHNSISMILARCSFHFNGHGVICDRVFSGLMYFGNTGQTELNNSQAKILSDVVWVYTYFLYIDT